MVFLHIVLRGISGVGKTTLRNRLVDFYREHGVEVVVFSKDNIRKEIKGMLKIPQYTYAPEQEMLCRKIYRTRLYNFLKKPCGKFADPTKPVVIISDCTNFSLEALNDSCFYWDDTDPDENARFEFLDRRFGQRIYQVLFTVGHWDSESRSCRPLTNKMILDRQRQQMKDSDEIVTIWKLLKRGASGFYIEPHSAVEKPDEIEEMGKSLLLLAIFNTKSITACNFLTPSKK